MYGVQLMVSGKSPREEGGQADVDLEQLPQLNTSASNGLDNSLPSTGNNRQETWVGKYGLLQLIPLA